MTKQTKEHLRTIAISSSKGIQSILQAYKLLPLDDEMINFLTTELNKSLKTLNAND